MATVACSGGQRLQPRAELDLPDGTGASLAVDAGNGLWVVGEGTIRHVERDQTIAEVAVPAGAYRWLGRDGGTRLFADSQQILGIRDGVISGRAPWESGSAVLDVRRRWILTVGENGEIYALDPQTLEPVWGWAAIGSATRSLALSPEGDRVYQAVEGEQGQAPEILVRDLQTSRIVRRLELPAPAVAMAALPDGLSLIAATIDQDGDVEIHAIEWVEGSPEIQWSQSAGGADDHPPILKASRDGDLFGVLVPEKSTGLRLFDAKTGAPIGQRRGSARDFDFGPAGTVYLLRGEKLLRLEVPQ